MRRHVTSLAAAILATAVSSAAAAPPNAAVCDRPVYMLVDGITHDRARMAAYTKALLASGLYAALGGYYVTLPRVVDQFEGQPVAERGTVIVRFPCLANARAFWGSKVYQETIKPLRLKPSAGSYAVTVYEEAPLPEHMVGKVSESPYLSVFRAQSVAPSRPAAAASP